ncbi:formate dehydrogenase subunit gamma, partial [Pseudoduganella sp. FT9W]|nr:formate dehydrogenase subunit gamma [Duganella alba]
MMLTVELSACATGWFCWLCAAAASAAALAAASAAALAAASAAALAAASA